MLEQGADDDWALRLTALRYLQSGYLQIVKGLVEQEANSYLITEPMLNKLFTSYDLQITKIVPPLNRFKQETLSNIHKK